MSEPAGSWLDPNVQFNFSNDPASFNVDYQPFPPGNPVSEQFESEMSPVEIRLKDMGEFLQAMAQQQALMAEQLKWLCFHVSNILQMAQSNPMVKMIMNKAAKNG